MPDLSEERLGTLERQLFLRTLILARPAPQVARRLAEAMTDLFVEAGTVLYRQGDVSDSIFFVVRGDVELTNDTDQPWVLRDRSVAGILDVLQDRPRSRTATALTDAYALVLPAEE